MKKPGQVGHHHPEHVKKKISNSLKARNGVVGSASLKPVAPKKSSKLKSAAAAAGLAGAGVAGAAHLQSMTYRDGLRTARKILLEEGRKLPRGSATRKAALEGIKTAKAGLRSNTAEKVARVFRSPTARKVGKAALRVLKFGAKRI